MNRRLGIAEILSQISKIKDPQERQNALSTCAEIQPLIQVLHATFHPEVKFLLPEGAPPFKKLEKGVDAQGTLYREAKRFYLFIDGLSPDVNQLKRETLFVQMLAALDPDDADLVLGRKDKKMIYPGITYELVAATFRRERLAHWQSEFHALLVAKALQKMVCIFQDHCRCTFERCMAHRILMMLKLHRTDNKIGLRFRLNIKNYFVYFVKPFGLMWGTSTRG